MSAANSYLKAHTYTETNVTLKAILEYDASQIAGARILGIPSALGSANDCRLNVEVFCSKSNGLPV